MRLYLSLLVFLCLIGCQSSSETYAEITTDYGTMKVMLYDSTPKHKANFIKLIEEGFYDSLLFHRIIEGFMIQGGDPDSKDAPKDVILGKGGPGYTLPAEIGAPHFKGALAAARKPDNLNPERASSGSQFFIVHGKPIEPLQLGYIENEKAITYSEAQRQMYYELGGYPLLDGDYTVFGEIVQGLEVLEEIVQVQTDQYNRPVENIRMEVKIVK